MLLIYITLFKETHGIVRLWIIHKPELKVSLKNVLIVDDEEDLTWSIAKHLSKDSNRYKVITVNSGAEALETLSKTNISLVISDIRMPEINGLDLLLKVRENYPDIKVIIMTAYGSSEIQEEANKLGCFRYIEKPFEIQKMREMIMDGIETRQGFAGTISELQLSDLIQMNCLGRLTNGIEVRSGSQKGIIFFEDGNIVHAQIGNLMGEEAFYEIISWEAGSFKLNKGLKADRESILKGWQSLLLEGLRRVDEAKKENDDPVAVAKNKIKNLLGNFIQTKGIQLLVLCNNEGKPFVSQIQPDVINEDNLKKLPKAILDTLNVIRRFSEPFDLKAYKEFSFEFEEGVAKMTWLPGSNGFLLLVANQSSNFGLLRIETKKFLKTLSEILLALQKEKDRA